LRYLFFICIVIFLDARENPFEKVKLGQPTFSSQEYPYLSKEITSLPSDVREISSIIIKYKTINGSYRNKILIVNKSIDWHKNIVITQEKKYNQKEVESKDSIKLSKFSFIKYELTRNALYIYTKLAHIRHFMLPTPYELIMDFEYPYSFTANIENIKNHNVIKSIKMEPHKDFFRVHIKIDGKYKYQVEKIKNGYKVEFK